MNIKQKSNIWEFNSIYDDETIIEVCNEWVKNKISKDFKFREYQLECIVKIIQNVLTHGNHNYVVEAPTGSGKSLINIISAGVLADYFDVTSYILVSDLFLWEQYANFLNKHKKTGIAMLKGKIGNYKCILNGEDITLADCTVAGLSWASMYNKNTIDKYGYDCAYTCPYVKARKKAVKSKVCLMTYQLFIQTFKKILIKCEDVICVSAYANTIVSVSAIKVVTTSCYTKLKIISILGNYPLNGSSNVKI